MAEMDGAGATAHIQSQQPGIAVLILTTYDTNSDILRAIEAGATGYLLKDTPRDELFAAIRSVAQGKAVLAPTVATRLLATKKDTSRRSPQRSRVRSFVIRSPRCKQ